MSDVTLPQNSYSLCVDQGKLFRGLHESLARMPTDYVDVMQLHNPSVEHHHRYWWTPRCACAQRHNCWPDTFTRRVRCSQIRPAWQPRCPMPIARSQRVRARIDGHGSRPMGRGGRACGTPQSPPSISIGCRTALRVPTFAAAARLAVHRGDLNEASRQLTRGMQARPLSTYALPFLALWVRLELAKAY